MMMDHTIDRTIGVTQNGVELEVPPDTPGFYYLSPGWHYNYSGIQYVLTRKGTQMRHHLICACVAYWQKYIPTIPEIDTSALGKYGSWREMFNTEKLEFALKQRDAWLSLLGYE